MRKALAVALIAMVSFGFSGERSKTFWYPNRRILPKYSHVVIVIEENKYYSRVIGSKDAPYINGVLVKQGANLTRMFAEEHNSEGNYFWIFSGSEQNVGHHDVIPTRGNTSNYPFETPNLGAQLIGAGYTFKGYAESLPDIGDRVPREGLYARKHVPWISFGNLPDGKSESASTSLQFRQFPVDFNELPTVSIVIPNLINDMHSGKQSLRVRDGDTWLKENLGRYYEWAKTHNSLLIITWDENSDWSHFNGLTNPASKRRDARNRIPTIIAGAHIRHGNYSESKGVTHVNLLRTIEAIYGLSEAGHQQKYALSYGIGNNYVIHDIFTRTH